MSDKHNIQGTNKERYGNLMTRLCYITNFAYEEIGHNRPLLLTSQPKNLFQLAFIFSYLQKKIQ